MNPEEPNLVKRISRLSCEEIAAAIDASHPVETDDANLLHADALAMRLVGARHDKRELVNIVRWLLLKAPNDPKLSDRSPEARS